MAKVIVGDSLTYIRFVIKDPATGALEDLTGKSLTAKWKVNGGTLKTAALSIVSPGTNGTCEFQMSATDFDAPGQAVGKIYESSSGKTGKSWDFVIDIERDLS